MKKDPIAMIKNARKKGEPTFTIRAKDTLSLILLDVYVNELESRIINKNDSQAIRFLEEVREIKNEFRDWRIRNVDKVKMPD